MMRLVGFFLITSYWRMLGHRFIVPQSYKSEERSKQHPISPAQTILYSNQAVNRQRFFVTEFLQMTIWKKIIAF